MNSPISKATMINVVIIAVLLVGAMLMSILGAEQHSLHIINLNQGFFSHLWEALWLALTASTFFLLGRASHYIQQDEEDIPDA